MLGLGGFLLPWVGPVIAGALPVLRRWRDAAGGSLALFASVAGLAVLALTVVAVIWLWRSRDAAVETAATAACVSQVASATTTRLLTDIEAQSAVDDAVNAVREHYRQGQEQMRARAVALEVELLKRPARGACYSAAVARRLNHR